MIRSPKQPNFEASPCSRCTLQPPAANQRLAGSSAPTRSVYCAYAQRALRPSGPLSAPTRSEASIPPASPLAALGSV